MRRFPWSQKKVVKYTNSNNIDNMNVFWDNNHSESNDYWLSKYPGLEILHIHNINPNEVVNKTVLDIGIGTGLLCQYLSSKNNKVIACDISNIALKRVEDICDKVYNTVDLKYIEPVDLAISNLVFQHCSDVEVERIIKEINLKPYGIFSFQFAFLRDNEPPNDNVKNLMKNGTHHFRSLNVISEMITRNGKKIVEISTPIHYYGDENFSHYCVKIGPSL